MSNNKQSSVEWLYNKMYEHRGNITIEEYEKAKAMHKHEMIQFALSWSHEQANRDVIEKEYNETYGE